MTDRLDSLLADIDQLETDDDQFPWCDAASWSADADLDDDLTLVPVTTSFTTVLTARLGDGRTASWSDTEGWTGDAAMIAAARAVAALFPDHPEITRAARGLMGAAVDGWACEACWLAARL